MVHLPQHGPAAGGLRRFVGGFGFSLLCCLIGAAVAAPRAFVENKGPMELLWLTYNSLLCLLFLVRTRPRFVSMNPAHWFVALITSFGGFFFESRSAGPGFLARAGDAMILAGLVSALVSAVALRRSYDFLPALRGVSTTWTFALVRHPMYASSMLIRLGYACRHPSPRNLLLMIVLFWLYHRRACIEEQVMAADEGYREYLRRVRRRFIPGIW